MISIADNTALELVEDRKTALLADGEPAEMWRLGRILVRAGFEVTCANDGEDAMKLVEERHFDLLVADIPLPRLDGLTLLDRALRKRAISCAVFSRNVSSRVRDYCLERGVIVVLDKDSTTAQLRESVDTFLAIRETISHCGTSFRLVLKEILEAAADSRGGEIVVRSGDKVGKLFFVGGKVAWAYASTERRTLVEDLIENGGLSKAELQDVYAECKASGKNFAETLVEWRIVEAGLVRRIMLGRISMCLKEMSTWTDPRSMFVPQERTYSSSLLFDIGEILGSVD